jgi:hypothetical protein
MSNGLRCCFVAMFPLYALECFILFLSYPRLAKPYRVLNWFACLSAVLISFLKCHGVKIAHLSTIMQYSSVIVLTNNMITLRL